MIKVVVEMLEGRLERQKETIRKGIASVIQDVFEASGDSVEVEIAESKFEDMASNGELRSDASAREGEKVYGVMLEPRVVVMGLGRHDLDQRRKATAQITDIVAEATGLSIEDILLFFNVASKEHFAVGGILQS